MKTLPKARVLTMAAAAATMVSMLAAPAAHATFSLVGADTSTKQVGSGFASCTSAFGDIQSQIYAPAPGKGAVNGQSFYFDNQGADMAALIKNGSAPKAVINQLKAANSPTNPNKLSSLYEQKTSKTAGFEGDNLLQRRQYLAVSTDPGLAGAGFTGSNDDELLGTPKAKRDLRGASLDSRYRAAIGGNTLTSKSVVANMKNSFLVPESVEAVIERRLGAQLNPTIAAKLNAQKDLASRMFVSLMAGGNNGGGDKRCTTVGNHTSSDSSWLRIDNSNGSVAMNLKWRAGNGVTGDGLTKLAGLYVYCRGYNLYCISQ